MPEGPQMQFMKEQTEQFVGQKILYAYGDAPIPFTKLQGKKLKEIKTFGKEIFFCLEDFTIRVHLMLFGKYEINKTLNRSIRLGIEFESGTINLYACDCRLVEATLSDLYDWSTDIMHPSFNKNKALEKLTAKPEQLICDALLDQNIVAGAGNIIKNEALFMARIHPLSQISEIPLKKIESLLSACISISFKYLEWIRQDEANEHWLVYRKKECPRDHIPLLHSKLYKTNRSCYYCEACQHLYLSF